MKVFLLIAAQAQPTDNIPMFWPHRVFNVVSCIVVWNLVLFVYYFRANPKNFTFAGWWKEDRVRFIAGIVVTFGITLLKATSQSVDEMLRLMGFQVTQSSGVAYGLAIAAFLLGLKSNGRFVQKNNTQNGQQTNASNK